MQLTYSGDLEAVRLPPGVTSDDAPRGVVRRGDTIEVTKAQRKLLPAAAGWVEAKAGTASKASESDKIDTSASSGAQKGDS